MLSTKRKLILTVAIAFLLVMSIDLYAKQEQRRSRQDGQEPNPKAQVEGNSQAQGRVDAETTKQQEATPSSVRNKETTRVAQEPQKISRRYGPTSREAINAQPRGEGTTEVSNRNDTPVAAEQSPKKDTPIRNYTPSAATRTVEVKSVAVKTESTHVRQEKQNGIKPDLNFQTQTTIATAKKIQSKSDERIVSTISTIKRPSGSSLRQRFNDSAIQLNNAKASINSPIPITSSSLGSMDSHTRGGRIGSTEHGTRPVGNNTTNAFVNHNTSYPYVSRDGGDHHDESNRNNVNIHAGFNFNDGPRYHARPVTYRRNWDRWQPHWNYYWSTMPVYYANYTWIRPSCGTIVYYQYNHHHGVSYIYPDYHRKYVFVSIGGYWPVSYTYQRYYWYGCHPTVWYGAYPQEYVVTETNNYYTYNSYSTSSYATTNPTYTYDSSGNIIPDYDALSQVRQNLTLEQAAEDMPKEKTAADEYFEKAVGNFAKQDYQTAMLNIREAIRLEPNDIVLPFVYCQTLFATEDYSRAAGVLRAALSNLPEDKQTVFFPRGLYSDESILNTQIEKLSNVAQAEVINGDLQLLLGYQLLGVSKFDEAKAILSDAAKDVSNEAAANILLELLKQAQSTTN